VVGAGQSAAEVAAYLHDLSPSIEVHGVFAKYGYSPADDSPFANRVFDPDAVDDFYLAEPRVRQRLLNYHRSTNYSAVDLPLIEDLYAREYAERVAGHRRLFLRGASSVHKTEEDADGGQWCLLPDDRVAYFLPLAREPALHLPLPDAAEFLRILAATGGGEVVVAMGGVERLGLSPRETRAPGR